MALVSFFSYVLLALVVVSGTAAGWLLRRLAPEEVQAVKKWLPKKRARVLIFESGLFFLATPHPSVLLVVSVFLFFYNLLLGIGAYSPKNN